MDAKKKGLMSPEEWDEDISDLHRTAVGGGTVCHTFIKASAVRGDLCH